MPYFGTQRALMNHAAVHVPAPGGSYTGPGDVVSGAYAWYGLRGYTAAYSTGSNPAVDLVDQAGANPITINILANGRLHVASINSWVTANSVSTIKVTRWYDQSGNARHANQATLSKMPVLNLTGFGSLPAMVFTASGSMDLQSGSVTQAQPITASMVYTRGSASGAIVARAGGSTMFARTSSGATVLNAGTDTGNVGTAANGSWHAFQGILNGASSAVFIDGAATTGLNAGTNGLSASPIGIGTGAGVAFFDGSMAEVGIWAAAFTTSGGGQADLINTNQHGADGYNF